MPAKPTRTTQALRWLLVAAGLAAAVLLVYAPLLLTNRVQGAGDAFTYFTPYRAFANAALRAGHLPLWNPYLFMGVPFLANPQSAVFYPLHWPWIGLDAAASLKASLALHLWLTALGSAVYVRRVARLGGCTDRSVRLEPERLSGRARRTDQPNKRGRLAALAADSVCVHGPAAGPPLQWRCLGRIGRGIGAAPAGRPQPKLLHRPDGAAAGSHLAAAGGIEQPNRCAAAR